MKKIASLQLFVIFCRHHVLGCAAFVSLRAELLSVPHNVLVAVVFAAVFDSISLTHCRRWLLCLCSTCAASDSACACYCCWCRCPVVRVGITATGIIGLCVRLRGRRRGTGGLWCCCAIATCCICIRYCIIITGRTRCWGICCITCWGLRTYDRKWKRKNSQCGCCLLFFFYFYYIFYTAKCFFLFVHTVFSKDMLYSRPIEKQIKCWATVSKVYI